MILKIPHLLWSPLLPLLGCTPVEHDSGPIAPVVYTPMPTQRVQAQGTETPSAIETKHSTATPTVTKPMATPTTTPPTLTVAPTPVSSTTPRPGCDDKLLLCAPLSRSALKLYNPMPGGTVSGYDADSGLDILGNRFPVFAVAAGTFVFSERGHTYWTQPPDTPNSVLIELDTPLPWKSKKITHIFYTHLAKLAFSYPMGAQYTKRIKAGEYLGLSGTGNGTPHLHIGFYLNNQLSELEGTYLGYRDVAALLGYKKGEVLPKK